MAIISNVKAQANRLYSGIIHTKAVSGIVSSLKDEGILARSQTKILNNISAKNSEEALAKLAPIEHILGADARKISEQNMETVGRVGLDGVTDKNTLEYMSKRSAISDELKSAQEDAIINVAKHKSLNYIQPTGIHEASSIINESAKMVDGQLSSMTPFMVAKEYYGTPLVNAINGVKYGDNQGAIKNFTKLGVRGVATAGAVGASGLAVRGTVKLSNNIIDRVGGNVDERQ